MPRVRGQRVLELGCGTAIPTLLLLDRLFSELASTEIHLQDYNRAVLELVTLPNVLLAWYTSPLAAAYRASAPDDDNDDDAAEGRARPAHGRGPGALSVGPALADAFAASLAAHRVRVRFFAGGWGSLPPLLRAERGYDVVLASETIYRTGALGAFLGVLRAAAPGVCLVAAKVLYFGVGGGVQAFERAVREDGGRVAGVWEHREGVGRRIMRVEWA
ncbi:hypothetical protein BC834DRAFT_888990 [Gloeopeniophorella convolvens]|nr:hypothetical protein BC834DRAFT_888990 [Gloeopeniophorella convolvens]